MNLQVRGFRISGSGFLVEGVGLQVQGWGFNVFAQGKVHCKASIRVAVATVRVLEGIAVSPLGFAGRCVCSVFFLCGFPGFLARSEDKVQQTSRLQASQRGRQPA